MACANCGQQLVHFRVDVHRARHREVVLTWLLCPSCRHVALANWEWRASPGQETTKDATECEDGAPNYSEDAGAAE
jgi:hypothetical protein